MRILHYIVIGLLSSPAFGQTPISTPPVKSVIDYRPIGEMRIWTFVSRDSTLGRLISVVRETKNVNGREGVVIQQEMALDMSKIGGVPMAKSSGHRWIALDGGYLGEETKLISEDQTNDVRLEVDGKRLTGYFTRGDDKVEQDIAWPGNRFVIDPYFADEMELFLARRGLKVGETFADTVFSAQTLLFSSVAGEVRDFIYTELYKGRFDSVFVIQMTQPEVQTLLVTRDFRLLRMDFTEHGRLRAYLDRVAMPQADVAKTTPVARPLTTIEKVMRLAHWGVYLLLSAVILWLFARRRIRFLPNWVGLLGGGLIYVLVIFLQTPLQTWLITKLVSPTASSGIILLGGVLPSLVAGFFQEGVILALLQQIARQFQLPRFRMPVIGAFVGAGFAIFEALYLTVPGPLIGGQLVERSFLLLFHISAGYLMGYLLALRWKVWGGWTALAVANSLIRFLPMLILQRLVSIELLHLFAIVISLAVAAGAVLITRKQLPAPEAGSASGAGAENPLT